MWLLLLVLLFPGPGLPKTAILRDDFSSLEECEDVKARVYVDMANAYPNDRDFYLVCQPKEMRAVFHLFMKVNLWRN